MAPQGAFIEDAPPLSTPARTVAVRMVACRPRRWQFHHLLVPVTGSMAASSSSDQSRQSLCPCCQREERAQPQRIDAIVTTRVPQSAALMTRWAPSGISNLFEARIREAVRQHVICHASNASRFLRIRWTFADTPWINLKAAQGESGRNGGGADVPIHSLLGMPQTAPD